MRELRDTTPGKIHLLSCRTLLSELLFIPKPVLTGIIGGVIARYQEIYAIEIFAIVVLGNHYHILCRSKTGEIHLFAENINREIARRVNQHLGRRGPVWGRRYDDLIVLEDKDAVDAYLYVNTNPTKHHLVEHSKNWPGICSYRHAFGAKDRTFKFFHFTEYHKALKQAERTGQRVSKADYYTSHTLAITPLSEIESLTNYSAEKLQLLLEERTKELVTERKKSGKGFLGRKAILNQPLRGQFPHKTNRTKRPLCYTKSPEARRRYKEERKLLRAAYFEASFKFRSGRFEVEFPPFTIRPPMNHIPHEQQHL